jgi:formamidopyrimidine-DNA glycosylase
MPELAEVEYFRKRWNPGLKLTIERVLVHPKATVFCDCDVALLEKNLTGASLRASETAAKQMLFRATRDAWLGIHLGMTGELKIEPAGYVPGKADHLVLVQSDRSLVFSDPRMFGRVQFSISPQAPEWWTSIAPPILSPHFTVPIVAEFLESHARSPIKAVLLMQERFPGVGNWMADEILWRAAIHPKQPAGSLTRDEIKTLHKECRWVCREALKIIGGNSATLQHPPETWLFPHRWEDGGNDPMTGDKLLREEIGGRTTCWSPARQKLTG